MLVRDYMTRPVIAIGRDTEFHAAFDLMRHHNIHHLPVVEAGRVVGIVAERDLLLAAANFGPALLPVGEIMRAPVACISPGASLRSAARMLVMKHIGSLPVVDSRKTLVGMITETDVFKVMAGMARPRKPGISRRAAPSAATATARGRRESALP
jgi:acetoin utilization protein AcuB